MNADAALAELAAVCGIEPGYHDIWGNYHALSEDSARKLLAAMGIASDDAAAIDDALQRQRELASSRPIPRVCVWREGDAPSVLLNVGAADGEVSWQLRVEQGARESGRVSLHALEQVAAHDGRAQRRWHLPWTLSPGYHELELGWDGQIASCTLVVAPRRCWPAPSDDTRGRAWGVSLQLYGVRSARNWGFGDLGDLGRAAQLFGQLGADLIGVNPLHALYPGAPLRSSPYSPSSRRFANPLYLEIEAMDDFAACDSARERVAGAGFQAELARLRASELVDYAGVAALKWPLLAALHQHFHDHHSCTDRPRGTAFRQFQAAGGRALRLHATFEAMQAVFAGQTWPEPMRNPESDAVAAFAAEHALEIEFREYLQWQLAVQLEAAQRLALASGMRIGIYRDLAVGSDASGADVWSTPRSYARGVSIGAPPDDFSLQGQVWGLAPWLPQNLQQTAYADYIAALRANMRAGGALRVDHVVGLMRLFWVAAGDTAAAGAFVRYPLHDLLSILALESVRQQCLIVGEDLGTVPDELRAALHDYGVLSYRVLYFSKHWHGDHSFLAPREFPAQALVTVTTHDLPTLAGYWSGHDLEVRETLGLYPDAATRERLGAEREHDRTRLLAALAAENLYRQEPAAADAKYPSPALIEAVHRYVARTPSSVMMLQMEDVLGQIEPINVPGTVDELPNWRRRLAVPLEAWPDCALLRTLSQALSEERARTTN